MDGISSRKLTWGICIVGIAIAIISFFFLPEIIPVHFAGNGVADDFGNKTEIFLMPILLLAVTILSGIKSIKYVLMHSKTWLTVGQYNLNYADVKQYQKQRGMEHSTMAITYASRKKKIILAA